VEDVRYLGCVVWIAGCVLLFLHGETKGHNLEEMDEIFKAKNPRAAARIHKERIDEAVAVVKVKGGD
jgi:hypothetical protein